MEKSGECITRVDSRGFNRWNIRGCSTHATGYLLRNIDLTFVVLFYLCVLVVIFCTFALGVEGVVMHL